MAKYALVAIGYNRPQSMQRLLNSLSRAYYGDEDVTLIISIDNSGTDEVECCANDFQWKYGEKKIVTYSERQGLRKHILRCGDFVKKYDAIAVFEDDVIVAPGFYQYMKETVDKYKNDDQIAGISLYNHLWNVNVNIPFEPAFSQYDVYFLQFAQSWGQVWMKKQWLDFAEWYKMHDEEFNSQDNIPDFVSSWPKTSWLKYHIKYCIEQNKFFVYPYKALSTCFSDVGEHCGVKETLLQISMLSDIKKDYLLPEISVKNVVKYDAFFERIINNGKLGEIDYSNICFDLYGSRKSYNDKQFIISRRGLPYKRVCSYALELKPHETNIIYEMHGDDFILYDSFKTESAVRKNNKLFDLRYYFRMSDNIRVLIKYIFYKFLSKIKKYF